MKSNQLILALLATVFLSCSKSPLQETEKSTDEKIVINGNNLLVNIDASDVGNSVENLMFGGVFEGHRLALYNRSQPTDNANYSESPNNVRQALDLLNLTFLRYPGGTYAVKKYDYLLSEDGNGSWVSGVSTGSPDEEVKTRHNDFINYCNSKSPRIEPQLIFPSKRFENNIEAGKLYSKAFLKYVNNTENLNVKYWNIGNEDNLDTIPNYPSMADTYSKAFPTVDQNVVLDVNVNFKWNEPTQAQALANGLSGNTKYNGIFCNLLETNLNNTEDEIVSSINTCKSKFPTGQRELQIGAWQANNIDTGSDPWMHTASIFVSRFNTMIRAGATKACVWPLMTNESDRKGRLVNFTNTQTVSLAPCGKIFNWLQTSANGKKNVNNINTNGNPIRVTAYRNVGNSTLIVFVCGMNVAESTVQLDVSNFANATSFTGEVISEGVEQSVGSGTQMEPNVRTIYPSVSTVNGVKKIYFGINKLSKYEVARIIIKN